MKLINANWAYLYTFGDADQAFNYFIRKLKRIYNKSFPFVMITNKNTNKPWLTRGILKSINTKNKLYSQAKRNLIYKSKYVQYRNKLTTILRQAKQHYYINTLNDVKNNSKKLWTHLNSIIKPNSINNCPVDCEKLNEFFVNVFKQVPIRPNGHPSTAKYNFVSKSFFLSPITVVEIISNTANISNFRSVGSDNLNPLINKANITSLAQQLTYIFNLSFTTGVFPKLLKDAVVTPIYKNGDNREPGNYRPISILTFFSKLLGKLFYNRIINFINVNNILHVNQFGFRSNKSTSIALANVLTSLISKINDKKCTIFTLLDLKKAFDLINHDLLLAKLQFYGIRGLPLIWVKS